MISFVFDTYQKRDILTPIEELTEMSVQIFEEEEEQSMDNEAGAEGGT